jgi:hypothetical protein
MRLFLASLIVLFAISPVALAQQTVEFNTTTAQVVKAELSTSSLAVTETDKGIAVDAIVRNTGTYQADDVMLVIATDGYAYLGASVESGDVRAEDADGIVRVVWDVGTIAIDGQAVGAFELVRSEQDANGEQTITLDLTSSTAIPLTAVSVVGDPERESVPLRLAAGVIELAVTAYRSVTDWLALVIHRMFEFLFVR